MRSLSDLIAGSKRGEDAHPAHTLVLGIFIVVLVVGAATAAFFIGNAITAAGFSDSAAYAADFNE